MSSELSDRQRAYIAAYTNPSAPTYLNSTSSYHASHPAVTRNSARSMAVQYAHNPLVRSEIESILNAQGATPEHSARRLAEIIDGTAQSESVQVDKDGNVLSRTIAKPRIADVVKSIDLRFKIAGHYARQNAAAAAQADIAKEEYSRLLRDSGIPIDDE